MTFEVSEEVMDALYQYAPGFVLARLWRSSDGITRLMSEADVQALEASLESAE